MKYYWAEKKLKWFLRFSCVSLNYSQTQQYIYFKNSFHVIMPHFGICGHHQAKFLPIWTKEGKCYWRKRLLPYKYLHISVFTVVNNIAKRCVYHNMTACLLPCNSVVINIVVSFKELHKILLKLIHLNIWMLELRNINQEYINFRCLTINYNAVFLKC